MTQEQVLRYNKRCAEFLNMKFEEFDLECYDYRPLKFYGYLTQMKFHSDWNWVMEVVEAIEKLGFRKYSYSNEEHSRCVFTDMEISYQKHGFGGGNIISDSGKLNSEKEAVVQAINEFLIWYNDEN